MNAVTGLACQGLRTEMARAGAFVVGIGFMLARAGGGRGWSSLAAFRSYSWRGVPARAMDEWVAMSPWPARAV